MRAIGTSDLTETLSGLSAVVKQTIESVRMPPRKGLSPGALPLALNAADRGAAPFRGAFASLYVAWKDSSRQYRRELTLVFAAYVIAGRIGLVVPFTSGNVSPVWPAAGIAMAAMLIVGYRVWPAIATAAFLVNFFTPIPAPAALGIAVGNTAGPLAGAWLTRQISGFTPSLTRLKEAFGLILIAAPLGAAVSASVGTGVLFTTGVSPWVTFGRAVTIWWLGDAMGILILTPLLLTLVGMRASGRQAVELVALLVSAAGTCALMFHPSAHVQSGIVVAAAVTPFVLWGATRFETFGVTVVVFAVCSIAVWQTGFGMGPFLRSTPVQNAVLLQTFLALITVSGLTLGAAVAEKSHLMRDQAHREGVAQSDRKYRRIVETANDGIWMLDDRLITIFANQRLGSLLGYTVSEMLGRSLFDFVFEEDSQQKAADLRQPREPISERFYQRYRKKDGSEMWALVTHTPTFDEHGAFTGVLKMVSDITEYRRAEQERQRARETVLLLSEAVDQTADSVVVTDSSGTIEYVNPAFETTTGYTRDEAIGSTPRLLKSGLHDAAFYKDMWDVLLGGQPFRGTLVNLRKNGERYWAEQTVTPIKDVHGNITHFVSVAKDVTVARKNQEQEIQLRLAREVQQRFYTAAIELPGFDIAASAYPAEQTGGDYVDAIPCDDGRCYVAIGDVSGHGLDAALVMAMTRAYVRSFAALGLNVEQILARVNHVLVGDLQEDRFVTLLLARLDPSGRTLEYASAGHVPGFLLNGAGDTAAVLGSTGVPLGIFADSEFSTHTFQLAPGHLVVLSTDGASETKTAADVEFGCEGVLDYVRAHRDWGARDIAEGIYRAARAFAQGEAQTDDVTCIIIKVCSSSA
jgi:PAS domain S-box-containing protein